MKTSHSKPAFHIVMLISLLISLIGGAVFVTPAHAAGLVVNSLLDTTAVDSKCTLREAVQNANFNSALNPDCVGGSGVDTITFSVSGTITLGSTLPNITAAGNALTLDGTGKTVTISGNNIVQVATVAVGASLTLNHLTIANGNFSDGGGITNYGTLTVTNSTFSSNSAINSGGGISNNAGTLTITNSTFSGNSAGTSGGGIFNSNGALTITNSTFSGNSTSNDGGGIYNSNGALTITNSTFTLNTTSANGGGILNQGGTVGIANSTFAGNSASGFGGGVLSSGGAGALTITNSTISGNIATIGGGGIRQSAGTLTLRNTIVANSTTGGDCSGTVTDGGNNIVEDNTCGFSGGVDPNLGALTGSPAYFPLNAGSPAINAGDDAVCAAAPVNNESQNGVTRPQGAHCDIGSYEVFQFVAFAPADGATLLYNRPTFDWSDFPGATGYQIQISKNITFTQLVSSTTVNGATNSTYTPTANLAAKTTMYWRVRAKLTATTYSGWSDIWSFTTANPPPAPLLTAPASNTLVTTTTVLLNWNDVTMPIGTTFQKYEVQAATNSTFTTDVVFDNAATSEYTTPVLAPNTKYYWRVRTYNSLGQYGNWSASRYLRAALSAPNSLTPGTVTPPGPANNIYARRPTFTWGVVTGATSYKVEVSIASTFATKAINATATTNSYTHTADLAANTTYFWRVKANGANGPSLYSQVRTFITGNPPSIPILSTPANNTLMTTTTPLLDWNSSTAPVGTTLRGYTLEIATNSTFSPALMGANVGDPTTNYTTLPLAYGTTYYWHVRSVNTGIDGIGYNADDEFSGWSLTRSFRIAYAAPVLTLPADLAIGVPAKPTFTWSTIIGATNYTLQVSKNTGFTLLVINKIVAAPTYTHTLNLAANTYYWRVRANGPYGPSAWSATFSFTTP